MERQQFHFILLIGVALAFWLISRLALVEEIAAETSPTASAIPSERAENATAKTNRCTVCKDFGNWWLVSPTGEKFFSLGICMFNQGSQREAYDAAKPSYAAWRHYDGPEAWADASVQRLQSWGFTTIGGWSDYHVLPIAVGRNMRLTPVLHMGSTAGAPWFDMWDEKIVRRIEEVAEKNMGSLRGDPRVIGYYSDNEIGWWNAILWKMTLEQPATSDQRQRLIALLHETYGDEWTAVLRDFEPQSATSWDELERAGMLWLKPGSQGIHVVRRFLSLVADRYYQLMRDTIHKFDPDALYLGDRYQSFYYPEVPRASRRYVDVVSTNLNASWNDGTFIRSYLDTLYALTGKPLLVSEFYMSAEENRSGNKNAAGGFPIVPTQHERSEALTNTLRSLARLPYVVGADWFQYYDEPPHGRKLDGEDFNFGLVDIQDRPYTEVTAAFTGFNPVQMKLAAATPRPDAIGGVPRAPENPFSDFVPMRALKNWDRERGFVPAATSDPLGDLYICWSPDALYLGVFVQDIVEPDYYRTGEIPEIDRAVWTIRVADHDPIIVRIGAGKPPDANDTTVRVESLSGTYHEVRGITVAKLPAERISGKELQRGDQIELESSYTTHCRAYRIEWKGRFVLGD